MGEHVEGRRCLRRLCREPPKVDGQPADEEEAEPERGHRVEKEGDRRRPVVEGVVSVGRLMEPDGDGDEQADDERRHDEDDVVGDVVLYEREDALVQLVGEAEVSVQQAPEVVEVLNRYRPVEPVRRLECPQFCGAGVQPEDGPGGVAREEVLEDEDDDRDDEHDHDRLH